MATSRRTRHAGHARPLGVLAVALVLVAATYLGRLDTESDVIQGPAPEVLSEAAGPVGSAGLVTVEELDTRIRTWSEMAAQDEADYLSATNLGVLYLGRARLSGDLSDYGRAGLAASRALEAHAAYGPARALDATVRFAIHDFDGALAAATALLADEPGNADALAVVGDASLEMGRLEAAARAYASLAGLAPGPALDVRLARLAYVSGDPARAVSIARTARDGALAAGSADAAFYEYQLGELARLAGDAPAARSAFEAALATRPAGVASLVGLARIDAAAGRLGEAAAGLERALAIAPQPEVLALLGDIRTLQGDAQAAADLYATVRLTAELGDLAGLVYDRQLVAFELDHGGADAAALAAAQASLAARPDAAGHDLLAWAFHRVGRNDEAALESEAALATGIVDARIQFHAGAIAIARGDRASGASLIRAALALGPALDPLERAEAERLLAGG